MTVTLSLRAGRLAATVSSPSPSSSTAPGRSGGAGPRLAALVAAALLAAPASAALVIDSGDPFDPDDDLILDVVQTVGAGINASYLIVDFGATGGDAWAWEWRWNPGDDARGATMLQAIAEATELAAQLGGEDGAGFGLFVENLSIPAEGEAGDPDLFWSYWVAEAEDVDPGIAWTQSGVGISFRDLSDGSIDGYYNGFDGDQPAVPTVLIPGPGGLALLGVAGLAGARGRRRV